MCDKNIEALILSRITGCSSGQCWTSLVTVTLADDPTYHFRVGSSSCADNQVERLYALVKMFSICRSNSRISGNG